MAHSEKYWISYCDPYGAEFRVSILQQDWEGGSTELEAQADPFKITYESTSGFKFDPIRPSYAVVDLVFGTDNGVDFEEFWTADEREFKVEHYRESVLQWVGYVIPNGFQYELTGGLYYAQIKASDGLTGLADMPFSYAEGIAYGTQDLTYNDGFLFPFVLIATEILRKLELDLNLWTCIDVYEQTMTKTGDTRDADPLAVSFANVKTYINDSEREDIPYWSDVNEVMNCQEVLENLCYVFGAKVYQNGGVWRIKRVNVDADYGSGDTQRYWRKYNTLAVYLGRETVNNQITIECATVGNAMIGMDHVMSMDEVYGAFRINYEYTLLREGDTPLSLLKNGNWANFDNTSKLAAPDNWFRWQLLNVEKNTALKRVDISAEKNDAGGNVWGLVMGEQAPGMDDTDLSWAAQRYSALRQENIQVTQGDILFLETYIKMKLQIRNDIFRYIFMCKLTSADNTVWYLINDITNEENGTNYLVWRKQDEIFSAPVPPGAPQPFQLGAHNYFTLYNILVENKEPGTNNDFLWRHYKMKIDSVPASGTLIFDVYGLGKRFGSQDSQNHAFRVFDSPSDEYGINNIRADEFGTDLPRPIVAGLFLGRIPDPDKFAEENEYIYENTTGTYTLEVDPIEVLNGDVYDDQHVSAIVVPSNTSGKKNFWDTIDNKYGLASIGLITVKSIMNLYIKPFRILEGTIQAEGLDFDKKVVFSALPNLAFIIQRGTFNSKRGYLEDVTFKEISNITIPDGGTEGGNNLDPNWQETGEVHCQLDETGVNTGFSERLEKDINPNSETFGDFRWTVDTLPSFECIQNEPPQILFGTDDISLDPDNLVNYPMNTITEVPLEVQCMFSNPGGEYIYFIHRDDIGIVEHVSTVVQDEIVSDFQYFADIVYNGYNYRVFRQNYITADFSDFIINFTFSE